MAKRLKVRDCIKLAEEKNGQFLSGKYKNNRIKYKWKCEFGHIFKATLSSVRARHWCPECVGVKRLTVNYCIQLAKLKNGKFVSTQYTGSKSKYKWECEFGHIWLSRIDGIQTGSWCVECKTIGVDGCKKMAEIRDGYFISTKYTNNAAKYKWKCKFNHVWEANAGNIRAGTWCPICKESKGEREINKILSELLLKNITVHRTYRKLDWLMNIKTGRKLELDFYVPDLNFAIEYQGEHHFNPVNFSGRGEEYGLNRLKVVKRLDSIKRNLLKKHNIYLIEISYLEKDIKKYLTKKFKKLNII